MNYITEAYINIYLENLNISEECREDLKSLVENQVVRIKRGGRAPGIPLYKSNVAAGASRLIGALTGKSTRQHVVDTAKAVGKGVKAGASLAAKGIKAGANQIKSKINTPNVTNTPSSTPNTTNASPTSKTTIPYKPNVKNNLKSS